MIRQIKFRVWDNVDFMSNPFTLTDIQSKKIQFTNDIPIMQFTGLHDRNGKEIYEGDVVNLFPNEKNGKIYPRAVIWHHSEWRVSMRKKKCNCNGCGCLSPGHKPNQRDWNRLEVIGNIYKNPNLLK